MRDTPTRYTPVAPELPGDGTAILAELLKQNAQRAVVGNIADPAAVRKLAVQAGVGKRVTVKAAGGKVK